jgi:hypothetical protein
MAQEFISAGDSNVLTRFTKIGSASISLTSVTDNSEPAIQCMGYGYSATAFVIDSYGNAVTDCEILLRLRIDVANGINNEQLGPAARVVSGFNGYMANAGASDTLFITRYDAGGRNKLTYSNSGITSRAQPHYIRLRVQGTALKTKMWQAGSPEPSTWLVETTDTVYSQGYVGFGAWNNYATNFIYDIGIGTNGDPAPTAPLSTGPNTPTNPAVTNLQATSARLTWDQG